jgi:hypothetical protein
MAIEMINEVKINETFHGFKYPNNYKEGVSGCYPTDNWEIIYDFMVDNGSFFYQSQSVRIRIWSTKAYYPKESKSYCGMFSYAEVDCVDKGVIESKTKASFFGETSEDDAFRWANDKAQKVSYVQ